MAIFIVVYASASKMLRRVVAIDGTTMPNATSLVHVGEAMLIAPAGQNYDLTTTAGLNAIKALIQAHTGVAPPDSHCAVVDGTNTVTQIIHADPAIDSFSGATLVTCQPAVYPGCTWNAGAQQFSTPQFTLPIGARNPADPAGPRLTAPLVVLPVVIP
jgi:hypothetical protein